MAMRTRAQRGMIKGQDKVIRNLNKEITAIKFRSQKGLTLAALIVKAESMKRTPVDTGNLKNEHGIDIRETVDGFSAIVYTGGIESEGYAVPVHENLDAAHPVGEARFLVNAMINKEREIVNVIHRFAMVR